jgi:hypothetical protein
MDWTKIVAIIALVRHIVDDIRGELDDEDPGVIDFDDLITLLTEKNLGDDVVQLIGLITALLDSMSAEDRAAADRVLTLIVSDSQ